KTIKQHEKWVWAFSGLKRKYQESFEVFFTDKNNVLNYDLMSIELCKLVNSGCTTPRKELSNRYKINPTLKRAATKLIAAKLRNELTFTRIASEETYIELAD
ncbi:MAG: hypothetical protein LM514_02025, partial [Streptococcus sp.]|nr:hypothetical protein [Streptococcus sp.]